MEDEAEKNKVDSNTHMLLNLKRSVALKLRSRLIVKSSVEKSAMPVAFAGRSLSCRLSASPCP